MGRLATVGRRLCLGTGRLLYGLEDALDSSTGWGALGRITGVTAGVLFVDSLIMRAPVLVYALPPAWLFAAWRMSDSSATPPPRGAAPSGGVSADDAAKAARGVMDPNGVMCILHPVREEVNKP